MNKFLRLLAISTGIGAILILLIFLGLGWGKPIWLTEDIIVIRVIEVIVGVISVPLLVKIAFEGEIK